MCPAISHVNLQDYSKHLNFFGVKARVENVVRPIKNAHGNDFCIWLIVLTYNLCLLMIVLLRKSQYILD